jgi:LmbE family N-acetylglucosaminyl deacetylase
VAALGAIVLFVEFDRRHGLYWYDVSQDYRYEFGDSPLGSIRIRIVGDEARLPELPDGWDTAVLSLDIASTVAGHWFEPALSVGNESDYRTHTLARGAEGRRYFVLDARSVASGDVLKLTGRHLRWREQDAELLLFATPQLETARVLILATHPDDAEIAAFGLYASRDSYVATVSAGNYVDGLYGHLATASAEQLAWRGRVRAWDSLAVPIWGDIPADRTVNLGYWNGALRALYERRESMTAGRGDAAGAGDPALYRRGAVDELLNGRRGSPTWRSLVADIEALIRTIGPAIIVTPHPALDAALDHQYTTIALLEAMKAIGDTDTVLLLYTNHHVLGEYYPFGPTGSGITLPPWFDDALTFGGVYSHDLDADMQMRKLFALEAMHDLRAAPRPLYGGVADRFLTRLGAAADSIVRDPLGTYSYLRRAVRQNEVFFVARPGDRSMVRQRAAPADEP